MRREQDQTEYAVDTGKLDFVMPESEGILATIGGLAVVAVECGAELVSKLPQRAAKIGSSIIQHFK